MRHLDTGLPGVVVLEPEVFGDRRGCFFESYNKRVLENLGIHCQFVQDNQSTSVHGVLRGLHYQLGQPQDKLVRVVRGEVFDVAVDVRRGSPYFGRWTGVSLSAKNRRQLFVPRGFAHGFYVVSEDAEFCYKCSDYFAPTEERGIRWSDETINIAWPLQGAPSLSDRDTALLTLAEMKPDDLPQYPGDAG